MINKITYYLLYGFAYTLSLLPFRLLYLFSDALYLLIYHIVRYRRGVVRKNLSTSFPVDTCRDDAASIAGTLAAREKALQT